MTFNLRQFKLAEVPFRQLCGGWYYRVMGWSAPAETHAPASAKEESDLEQTLRPLTPDERAETLYRKGVGLFRSGQDKEG